MADIAAKQNESGSWMVLVTVIIGTFLGRLDQTIVTLALPKMINDFSLTVSTAGWIATSYILANAVFVPIWGKLGDTIGRKKVYLSGFIIFIIGSVMAGFAWNFPSMILFRIIQAIAVSADYPSAMSILAVTFPHGKKRAQAMGIWSSAFAAAVVFGPLIGGPMIDNFGWRSIFLINLPVGLIGLLMAWKFVKESMSEKKAVNFDFAGAITLGIALSSLVLVLDKGYEWGWSSSNSLLCYSATAIFSIIFYFVERNHPEPIVDLKFFKNLVFVNTLANNFVVFMSLMGGLLLIPIFASTFLGYNATQTGYLFIPMAIAMVSMAPVGAALTGKIQPRYVIAASTLIAAIGILMFNYLDPRSTAWDIVIPLMVMAAGMGLGMSQRTNVIASAVPIGEIGVASSILALARNIAGAFGIALFTTVLNNSTETKLLAIARHSAINIANRANYSQAIALMELKAHVAAYGTVYTTAAAFLLVGAITALWIKTDKSAPKVEIVIE
jgi:EmrB/QacA subfamily drug resistance transporter